MMKQNLYARKGNVVLLLGVTLIIVVTFLCFSPSPFSRHAVRLSQERGQCSHGQDERLDALPLRSINHEASFLQNISQDDPVLAAYIRRLIVPPSTLPYNLTNPRQEHFSQLGQTQFLITKVLPNMTGGFFLEVGAVDGEFLSNTLFLERRMGWRGLLIEAFPGSYQELLYKHRKAYSLQAALSLTNTSAEVKYHVSGTKGVLSAVSQKKKEAVTVQAFPLYAILKALDVPVIDYFSLDIEGVELEVLATVPWDRVKVRVMHVEYNHLRGGTKNLVSAMAERGMHFIGTRSIDAWFVCPELYKNNMTSSITAP